MYLSHLRIISTFYLVHHLLFTGAGELLTQYYPEDDIAVNCGSTGISSALDGREWIGDVGSKFTSPKEEKGKSISSSIVHQSLFADHVPYMTARISRAQFTYTFQLRPGQKFIRLHFFPALYPGFERSKALITVTAGPYTLLSNFSASLTANVLGVRYFAKEFCVNIENNQVFSITFSPFKSSASDDVYAFINGIEIVSMPAGLYYTPAGDLGTHVVGNEFRFYIDNGTALEMIHRLNVGGRSILSVEDLGMFRMWYGDKKYLLQSSYLQVSASNMITYTNIPTYSAPLKVYQTAWSIGSNQQTNQVYNFTWKLPIDLGFRYLVRLHFCELEPITTETSKKRFDLMINNKIIEADADVIKWSGGHGVAVYKDYMVMMEGDRMKSGRDLIIALQLKYESSTKKFDAILKGIEIFKLSNPDNNLASVNPVFIAHAPISGTPKLQKLVLPLGSINMTATGIILVLTLLNFIVYHLNRLESNSSKISVSSSLDEELQRRFSLVEIQLATHNFDDGLVIGRGGFGNVYKGLINMTRTVAIKRLNSQSKQGAHEFWAEINTLSKLRHNHLVSLIGYCDDCEEMILVYEYMVHGTLADHLHKASRNGSNKSTLSWEQRLNVCIGAARGLDFLHRSSSAHHGIIHRDVKSSNILLDENWVAKISDFGLSKMDTANISRTHMSTKVKGTFGYLDPEYLLTERLTKKSDVYGFGVVLFEVLCGRRAVDLTLEEEEHSLALWAQKCIRKGTIDQLVDSNVKEQISSHCLRGFAEIANKCLHDQPNKRPTMAEIVANLTTLELQGRADSQGTCIEEQDIDVGEISIEHTEWSIMSNGSPSTSGHYSMSPIEVINESKEAKSMSPGTNKNMELGTKKKDYSSNNGPSWGRQLWGLLWNRPRLLKKKGNHPLAKVHCRRFSLLEIQAATNNFDDCFLIKNDDYGKVYQGDIQKIGKVTIERHLNRNNLSLRMELVQSHLRCINVVSLVGYCYDELEMILVYEYMANKTLSDCLHNTINNPLSWKQRLQICIGAARGLNYLHTGVVQTNIHGGVTKFVERTIIHRDVKSSNILLDQNWVAKIAGFGSSLFVSKYQMFITTKVAGTPGYVDPEYLLTSLFSIKSDVYSFGVVLLEVLCARKAVVSMEVWNEWRNLSKWALDCIEAGSVEQIIDPYLIGNVSTTSLNEFVEIARKCLLPRGSERPSMTDVVRALELALELQETADVALENEDMELSGSR
ncbi:receptor-like protein kinase FERONIA [Cornus florida]|uniref:receptor-like protein kinase FERONIA n=1 Tax=Cornus florida TaxID=4283 RepID=UPI00289F8B7B|nr:receptor-like protein kinase FERONIA [Cornus florida]